MNARFQRAARRLAQFAGTFGLACALTANPRLACSQQAAPAAASAGVVEGYPIAAGDVDRLAAQLQQKYQGRGDVRIAPDARTRKIVAIAPAEVQREIAAWLAQPPAPPVAGAVAPRETLPADPAARRSAQRLDLKHVSWKDFEDRLFRVWGARLSAQTNEAGDMARFQVANAAGQTTLEVDRRRGQVTIDAPGETAGSWLKVLGAIDAPQPAAGQESRIVPLDKADPAMVMRAVSLIRAATRPELVSRGNRKQHIGQFVGMIFQPEAGGAQAALQPDAPPPPQPEANQFEVPAEGGVAQAIVGGGDALRLRGSVTIDIVGDVLVVRGPKEDVERVLKIIDEIERQSVETRPEVELYQLKHVDATALNEVITAISTSALAYQGTVTITPLRRPNALLLVGRKENIPAVVELIQKLDRPTPPDTQVKVFQLKFMSAIDAERFVRNFFVEDPGRTQTARTNLGTRVMSIADFRSNSLIVQASPRDLTEVAQLLLRLDVEESGVKNEVRVFKLRNSIAEELAPALQEAITGVGAQGQQQQQQQQQQGGGAGGALTPATATRKATALQLLRVGADGQQLIQSGVLADMRITADTRSNSLVVIGPPSSMELMTELIRQLDELPTAEAQLKVFTIANGDATTLVEMLQNLFGQQQQQGGQGQFGQTATGQGESALVPLRFSVDQRTNSIIVSGNPGDLDVVRNILARLDVADLTQRITTVYRLHNAPAADVATAINNLLDRQRDLNQAAPELVTPYQQIEREVLIEPETVTNSLIVSATPRYFEEIKKIVTELDRRPPMVVIQVVIAEVTLTDNEQFGIEWGLQDSLSFDRSTLSNRFNFNNAVLPNDAGATSLATRESLAGQALSNLSVGRVDPTLGFGGLVLSASNESVNVLLRALEQSSRAQVISRPQVQTLDNQLAYVNVGALVPRIQGATQSTFGVTPTVSDIAVGIILEVTPRTSPDGTVVLQVNATKSSVGPESTAIPIFTDANGNVVRSPQIPLTTAQTTVSARSGQTVILGGLITKDLSESTRRIPYLADIPLLGRLFRFDTVSNTRTELLVIMTPYIMQNEEQNAWMNARESERMSWCIADIVNIHGPVGLSGNPAFNMQSSDVIFPDMDPTAPEPTPATPSLPGLGAPGSQIDPLPSGALPLLPSGNGLPLLPSGNGLPLLPSGNGLPPPGGYGLQFPPPVQMSPVPIETSQRRPADAGGLQPPAIQSVAPPPGTQAQWGQGVGPPGAVMPAMYQR